MAMHVTDWMPIGDIEGHVIHARCTHYDELGTPRCQFEVRSDRETTYVLGRDANGLVIYTEEGDPESSYHPASNGLEPYGPFPERIAIRQGWSLVPRYLADGSPWVFKVGGSDKSKGRPPEPDFSTPGAVEALDRLADAFRSGLPEMAPKVDLYRVCEGDNPDLLRSEPV